MTPRINQYATTLIRLSNLSECEKRRWLKTKLDKDFVHCVCECALNLLRGKVPLDKRQRSSLIHRKKTLRELIRRKVSLKRKKKIIQTAGFLGALIDPIISILDGLLGANNIDAGAMMEQ